MKQLSCFPILAMAVVGMATQARAQTDARHRPGRNGRAEQNGDLPALIEGVSDPGRNID